MTQEQISRSRLNAIVYNKIQDRQYLSAVLRDIDNYRYVALPTADLDRYAFKTVAMLGGMAAPVVALILKTCGLIVAVTFSLACTVGIIAAGVSAGLHLYRSISHVCN